MQTIAGQHISVHFKDIQKVFQGAGMDDELMDIYISILCESVKSSDIIIFPASFSSYSLFSLTATLKWAVDTCDVIENYLKFFPTLNLNGVYEQNTFVFPFFLENEVWILFTAEVENENLIIRLYHPQNYSIHNFTYLTQYV